MSFYVAIKAGLKKLRREKWITRKEFKQLIQIYRFNPLLFDFVLKRTIKIKVDKNTEYELPDEIFLGNLRTGASTS
ncbi:MAG: hypothetical protein ACYST3_00150 [Planctomycetota bacterium]